MERNVAVELGDAANAHIQDALNMARSGHGDEGVIVAIGAAVHLMATLAADVGEIKKALYGHDGEPQLLHVQHTLGTISRALKE